MRIIVQRVNSASVIIEDETYSSIGNGLLCLVGFCDTDTLIDLDWALSKITKLKLFKNQLSLDSFEGELLIISQFTLFANIKKGTKPSWSKAANPQSAKKTYDLFVSMCRNIFSKRVKTGVFGANMKIKSINDGPLTLIIDTKNKDF